MKRLYYSFGILLISVSILNAQVRIKMKQENGVYTTPCIVNGLRLKFIFDTGASNVSISLTEALFMLKNGYLNESDLHGSSYSQIANGEIVKNTTITLKEIEIGGIKLLDIQAVIMHDLSAPLLLGQSAIKKLGKIQIDGDELTILNYDQSPEIYSDQKVRNASKISFNGRECLEAIKMLDTAFNRFEIKMFKLSSDIYEQAFNKCSEAFDTKDFERLLLSFYLDNNFNKQIFYGNRIIKEFPNPTRLYFCYFTNGESYRKMKDYNNALSFLEKAIFFTSEYSYRIDSLYLSLGECYLGKDYPVEAIDYLEKSINIQLKELEKINPDIPYGALKSKNLGNAYWYLRQCYIKLNSKESEKYLIKAAHCGNESAIELCTLKGFKF